MDDFKLPPDKPLVIAEIALAHDGSLGNAIAYIRACADAGAGAVKFQCHDGDDNPAWRAGLVQWKPRYIDLIRKRID